MAIITAPEFRGLIESLGRLNAAREISPGIKTDAQACALIWTFVKDLLDTQQKGAAATVLWGNRLFDSRPQTVRDIWRVIDSHSKVLIMGCGSVGKSYVVIGWEMLDWLSDPYYTSHKIISTTSGHAKANTFSTLVRFHKASCIPLPGIPISGYLGLDTLEKKSGLQVVAIPTGDDGKGRLQGFHPDPRETPHPAYGENSRCRVFGDEGEEIPNGVHEGIDNFLLSQSGPDTVKVIMAYNPKDPTSKVAQLAEPEGGWEMLDIETGVRGKNEWISKNGWHVLRIDGKYTENVQARKVIYTGFLTYDGYASVASKNGGNTPEYHTFARGIYPPDGVNAAIITPQILTRSRGEFIFDGYTTNFGAVDTAVDGRDACVFTKGRAGMARAFRKKDGELVKFVTPRFAAQADQQFELKKGDTKIVGDEIIKTCIGANIQTGCFGMDATGNGAAVWAYVCAQWGEILGIDFTKPATTIKILSEDKALPEELYQGLVTEVWYGLRYWMEFGYFAIHPGIRQDPLEPELLGRRYELGEGKLVRVEDKKIFKKRLGRSPDWGDSLTVFGQTVRMRGQSMFASMKGDVRGKVKKQVYKPGVVDVAGWV